MPVFATGSLNSGQPQRLGLQGSPISPGFMDDSWMMMTTKEWQIMVINGWWWWCWWLLDDYWMITGCLWMFMDVYGRYIQLVTMVYNTERSCRRFILLTWMKGTTPCSKSLNLFVKAQFLQDFPQPTQWDERIVANLKKDTWTQLDPHFKYSPLQNASSCCRA